MRQRLLPTRSRNLLGKPTESAGENGGDGPVSSPSPAAGVSAPSEVLIQPRARWSLPNPAEVWRYRDLLVLLVWRDFSTKYRQSVIGIAWALLRPLVSVLVFTLVFGMAAALPSDGLPYSVFALAGLIPWMYFAGCLAAVSGSVVGGQGLLTKVHFPRLILPLAAVLGGLIDLMIQMGLLVLLMAWHGLVPGWQALTVPLFVLLAMITALGCGLWLTVLNVKYRDVGQAVPFFVQMWMWITPVVYAGSMVPEPWRPFYSLNPLVAIVGGFRWAMLGEASPDSLMMCISAAVMVILLIGGLAYFRRAESTFADVI